MKCGAEQTLLQDDEEGQVWALVEDSSYLPDPAPRFEFLTGLAGTGKSFLTKDRAAKFKGGELVATTGIAAINVGGSTINSLLQYFDTEDLRGAERSGRLTRSLLKLFESGVRRIYLDEVSMMDGNQLEILTRAAQELDEYTSGWAGEERMGITLVGDFCQLPPVKAPFAFQSPVWDEFAKNTTKLTEIKRQDNKDFAEALNLVRAGNGRKAVEFFTEHTTGNGFNKLIVEDFPGPTVMAKNIEVDSYNQRRLDQCQGEPFTAKAVRTGKQRSEWKQIPDELLLKDGAQVMILANRTENGRLVYCNGDIGTFVLQARESRYDRSLGDYETVQGPAVKLNRTGTTHVIDRVERENKEPSDKKEHEFVVVGKITYLPLRLAYATTVHKSQGLSLDDVQVNIMSHFFQSPAMLYVALSRARSPKGLRLVGTPDGFIRRCVYDPKVKAFL